MAPNDDDDLYGDLDITLEKSRPKQKPTRSINSGSGGTVTKRKFPDGFEREIMSRSTCTGGEPSPCLPSRSGRIVGGTSSSAMVAHLEAENESMKERIRVLEEENSRLRRNIGTLFRTAKNEIQRKDDQIDRFQRQQVEEQR